MGRRDENTDHHAKWQDIQAYSECRPTGWYGNACTCQGSFFLVPLRYVSQELGASVDWDDATQTNTIIYYK